MENTPVVLNMQASEAKKILNVVLTYVYPNQDMYVAGYGDIINILEAAITGAGVRLDRRKYCQMTDNDRDPTVPRMGRYFKEDDL